MSERSPGRRERQAQQTQEEILRAARRLFAEHGYARTTVKQVADAAGVSAQTVYDSIGSKRALVTGLNDLIDDEAGIRDLAMRASTETDPWVVVATSARITRAILECCGDIVHAIVTGSASEPELAAVRAEGQQRHRTGAAMVVAVLEEAGVLHPKLTSEEAVDTLAALTDPGYALLLRDDYGWSPARIEAWSADACRHLLLRPEFMAPPADT